MLRQRCLVVVLFLVGLIQFYEQPTTPKPQQQHEIVYWRDIPADKRLPPMTDQYLTFEFDRGGFNNVRMAIECLVVIAHATNRTLVLPPPQNLYLLGAPHGGHRRKVGVGDFFDLNALGQRIRLATTREFLNTTLWGHALNNKLVEVADALPEWGGSTLLTFDGCASEPGRRLVTYDAFKQKRHIHVRATGRYRLLNHFYALVRWNDTRKRYFYNRLIRDAVRYREEIQSAGARAIDAVRGMSRRAGFGGAYYALHVRRGDFQYKQVKIAATDIVANLRDVVASPALVYLATDDPDGTCRNCKSIDGVACLHHDARGQVGCPSEPSWDAFRRHGWTLITSTNLTLGTMFNPNWLGHVESIVCSRAHVFAGTWFSTFSGYIHRLRGYHGLGEATYYHTPGHVDAPQHPQSLGSGYIREWRAGWQFRD